MESGGRLKRGENEGAKSKSYAAESNGRTRERSKPSKEICERRAQTSRRYGQSEEVQGSSQGRREVLGGRVQQTRERKRVIGQHGSKVGAGSKGTQQVENSVMDEDHGNMRTMKSEEEERRQRGCKEVGPDDSE